jgi:hypothetical protein
VGVLNKYYLCRTYDSYRWLLEKLHKKHYKFTFLNVWSEFGSNTMIRVNVEHLAANYGDYRLYLTSGLINENPKTYIEVTDLMKDESITKPTYYAGDDGKDLFDRFESGLMTRQETIGFYKGNIAKYVTRYAEKNGVEDLKKAQVYLGRLIEFEKLAENDDRIGAF